jgi:small subunit ribosomal protein S8
MDTISNLLTSLRNAELASHASTTVPDTKLSRAVLGVLTENGFVGAFSAENGNLTVPLTQPSIRHHYKRISKPSRRVYVGSLKIPTVRQGLGTVILSTSAGVLSGAAARKQRLGGELLCEVY